MAFVSSSNNNTSNSNEAVNAAHRVTTASTQVNATNSTNIDNLVIHVMVHVIMTGVIRKRNWPNNSTRLTHPLQVSIKVENSKAMSSKEEPKVVRKNDDAPIIEEWVSDSEEENVS
ncbi:hypothetical protein Tco_0040821 [Tanacetum coccineum]